jgi:hypothetical protein
MFEIEVFYCIYYCESDLKVSTINPNYLQYLKSLEIMIFFFQDHIVRVHGRCDRLSGDAYLTPPLHLNPPQRVCACLFSD